MRDEARDGARDVGGGIGGTSHSGVCGRLGGGGGEVAETSTMRVWPDEDDAEAPRGERRDCKGGTAVGVGVGGAAVGAIRSGATGGGAASGGALGRGAAGGSAAGACVAFGDV